MGCCHANDNNGSLSSASLLDTTIVNKKINRIAVICAMLDEAKGLSERLHMKESKTYGPQMAPFLVLTNEDNTVFLIVNGKDTKHKCDRVGTQWSTLSAYLTIHKLSPDIIINAGTCGGVVPKYCFDKESDDNTDVEVKYPDVNIADVFIGAKVIYSDRRVPIPAWQPWDAGHYELFGASYLNKQIDKLKIAPYISSSNAFDYTKQDQTIYKNLGVVCKEMECAAIAEMCAEFGCKLIALKGVADLVNHHDHENFLQNLGKTVKAVTDVTELVIREISGKQLSDIGTLVAL
eukprot:476571_1